jgi:hypothetical protein
MAESLTQSPRGADDEPRPGATASAILVVVVIGVLAFLAVVIMAVSTERTPHTVDGRAATTSQFID